MSQWGAWVSSFHLSTPFQISEKEKRNVERLNTVRRKGCKAQGA